MPKSDAIKTLRRAGIPAETIEALSAELPDEIDLDRDGDTLLHYGISRDMLIARMGGSP